MQTKHLWLFLLLSSLTLGCHAQSTPAKSAPVATAAPTALELRLNRRIQLTIRSQYNVPPDYTITIGKRSKSEIAGYDSLPVTFSQGGRDKVMNFLISSDNNTLARLDKFDLSKSPMAGVNLTGRPVRGFDHAMVTVVSFDDLECPYCAQMHAELFPATMKHYGNQVRFIYKDDPLTDIHPWAMHAAVDVECLAALSQPGYWNLVDYIHAHGDEITGDRSHPNMAAIMLRLDQLTLDEGKRQGVKAAKLESCVGKQEEASVRASMKEADGLGINGTPILFINGERAMGLIPQSVLWDIINRAIIDAGGTPPPQVPAAGQGNGPAATPVH